MDADPVLHIRELRDGIAFKGTELLPGHCAHFRFAVEKRGADLEVVVRRTFGGAPTLLLNYGDLPAETQHHDGEIEAIRNDFRGEDIGGVISVVVPWREVGMYSSARCRSCQLAATLALRRLSRVHTSSQCTTCAPRASASCRGSDGSRHRRGSPPTRPAEVPG